MKQTYLILNKEEGYVEISARVYDEAAVKYFGEFAKLNFPLQEAA